MTKRRASLALNVSLDRAEAAELVASLSRTTDGGETWRGRVTGTVEAREVGDEIEVRFAVSVSGAGR